MNITASGSDTLSISYKQDKEAYKICKQRGHTSDGTGTSTGSGPMVLRCKFCNTGYYWTEPELVEFED